MSTVAPGASEHDPHDHGGWTSQLVAVIRQAVFDPSWHPTLRVLLIATVAVSLYLAVYITTRLIA